MAEGFLPPVIARLVADASEYSAGMARAVGATRDLEGEMDRADLTARKMAVALESAAQKAAAASERQAAAAQAATAATQELSAIQKQLADGEITAAEAADRQAVAEERLVAANEAQARAALQVERASIAQAEAQSGASRAAAENAAANEAAASRATGAWGRFNGVLQQVKTLGALAIGAVAVESVKMSTEFNKQMESLHTQAGAAQSEVDQLKNKVLALAPAVGFGPDKLAEALYHIESVGYRGADAMKILKSAADGAQVGNASLDDTTYALTSTMKSFEMEGVGGATQAMGALNAIVGQGDMRMQDLNDAIGTGIASTAQTFGLSIESMGAGLDFLTDRGEKANTASTRLAMGITLMAAPSAKAAKILGDLGLASSDVTAGSTAMADALSRSGVTQSKLAEDLRQPDGLYVALKDLKDGMTRAGVSAQEQGEIIAKVFGGARTGKAVMALFQNLEGVRQKYEAIGAAENNFGEAVKKNHETAAFQWKAFAADLQVIAIKIGDVLTPVLVKTLELVRFLGRTVAEVAKPFIDLGSAAMHALAPLGGPIEGVIGGLGRLVGAVAGNRVAVMALAGAFVLLKWESIVSGASAAASAIGGLLVEGLGRAYFAGYRLVTAITSLNAATLAGMGRFAAYSAGAAILVGVLASVANGADHARKSVTGITDSLDRTNVDSYRQKLDELQHSLRGLSGASGFFTMIGHALSGKGDVVQDKNALRRAIDDTRASMQRASDAARYLGAEFGMSQDQVSTLAKQFGITDLSVAGSIPKFEEMARALGGDKKALQDAGAAAKGAAQDVIGFDDAITKTINLKLGLHGALLTMNQDLLDLKNNLAGGSRALNDNTASGIKNSQALDKLVGDYSQYADALGKSNIPADQQIPLLQRQYDKLMAAGTAAGFTRQQVTDYLNSLDLIRPVASTDFQTPGLPQAQQGVDNLQGSLNKADGTNVAPNVTAPGAGPVTNEVENLIHQLQTADSINPSPNVTAPGLSSVLTQYQRLDQLLNTINGRVTHTYSINDIIDHVVGPGTLTRADGGVVDYYAAGGIRRENHVAEIAPAGSWRVFGEPETGGEAYIPMGLAKRGRSLEILAEVMKRFGLTAADALAMLGNRAAGGQVAGFAAGGVRGGDGASAGGAAAGLGGGYSRLAGGGDDLSRKTQDLTKHLTEQTRIFKDQNATVVDGHGKLKLYTDAVTAHHQAVDQLIPRVVASTGVHQVDHRTVDSLTGGYHTLTGAIHATPTAHHTNTDAPGAVSTTAQIRQLEATIRSMQPKTDRITIDTSVSGVFANLFARGGLVGLAGGGLLHGPGTGTSDSILGVDAFGIPTARVSNGEFVINERATQMWLPYLQAINATGLAAGGPVTSVHKPTVSDAGQYVAGAAHLPNTVDEILHPRAQKEVERRAAAEVKKKIEAMSSGVGGGVSRWAPLVLAVDKMLGLSPALLGVELSQMSTESGGNPTAINLWDSNAAAGHPSKGLMQVIDPTFNAYAGPFRGLGIWNPMANIYAALNYARSTYGSGLGALGHGHGYAGGGLVGMASGGYIMEDDPRWNATTMGNRRSGIPFWNLTNAQIDTARRDMSDLGFGSNIRLAQQRLGVGVDGIVGPRTLAALQAAESRRGGRAGMPGSERAFLGMLSSKDAELKRTEGWSGLLGNTAVTRSNAPMFDAWVGQMTNYEHQQAAFVAKARANMATHPGNSGAAALYATAFSWDNRAKALVAQAQTMQAQARAAVAGYESVAASAPGPSAQGYSWLALHSRPPLSPGPHLNAPPTHATVTVPIHIDGKKVAEAVQTQVLRHESRNVNNGLTRKRG